MVVVNPEERRPAGALREALGVPRDEPLHVVHQAGEPGEWSRLAATSSQRPLHVFAPVTRYGPPVPADAGIHVHDGDAFFPLAAWLGDADVLHTGAGYNAYWEARWLGYDAKTTFMPFRRNIDDLELALPYVRILRSARERRGHAGASTARVRARLSSCRSRQRASRTA